VRKGVFNMSIIEEKEVKITPEMGTSGIASALQIGSSTSTYSFEMTTAPGSILVLHPLERTLQNGEETFKEILKKLTKKHRETLDSLT
jgi:hypothetical protein